MHLIITDSGLGGLSICAEIESLLRQAGHCGRVLLTYFNASPDRQRGYNDMPDMASRARMFDRALASISQLRPDRILIACNTLSIIYPATQFSRTSAIPVQGIIDSGVDLFFESLTADPSSAIVMIGTRTTIHSGTHRGRLLQLGIDSKRIATVSCHGLAASIEIDPDGPIVAGLIDQCTAEACRVDLPGDTLYMGLCCTHYTYVGDQIGTALERHSGRKVAILDPNHRLANSVAAAIGDMFARAEDHAISVQITSKVELDEKKQRVIADRIKPISESTVAALLSYTLMPDLF